MFPSSTNDRLWHCRHPSSVSRGEAGIFDKTGPGIRPALTEASTPEFLLNEAAEGLKNGAAVVRLLLLLSFVTKKFLMLIASGMCSDGMTTS